MTQIEIAKLSSGDPFRFEVRVGAAGRATRHEVTLSRVCFDDLCRGAATPEQCVRAAFLFLLDREPADVVLKRFDLSVIGSYFPDFSREFPRYLSAR